MQDTLQFPNTTIKKTSKFEKKELTSIKELNQYAIRTLVRNKKHIALFFEENDHGDLIWTRQDGITKQSALIGLNYTLTENGTVILPSKIGDSEINRAHFASAATKMHPGDTLEKFIKLYSLVLRENNPAVLNKYCPTYLPAGPENFQPDPELTKILLKIHMPTFEKKAGKRWLKTFTSMTVKVNVPPCGTIPDLPEYLKANQRNVKLAILKNVQKYKSWQNYEYPINQLRLSSMKLKCRDLLVCIFTPKTEMLPKEAET